jgi:branched-chain amino acid transport system substrate-binding protein
MALLFDDRTSATNFDPELRQEASRAPKRCCPVPEAGSRFARLRKNTAMQFQDRAAAAGLQLNPTSLIAWASYSALFIERQALILVGRRWITMDNLWAVKRSVRSLILCLAAVLLAAAPAVFSQSAEPTVDPIRIGLIFPLTGGSSDMGNSARIGAEVAVAEINQVGGLLGRPLQLVIRDDKADPDTGLGIAQELVLKDKVTATVGFCNTGVAAKALDVFQNNSHLLFVTCATGSILTSKFPPASSYIFRNSARDTLQTQFLVNDIVRRGLTKVALLVDSTGYGNEGLKDLEASLDRAGLKPQIVIRFKLGTATLADELRRARDSGADSLIGWTVGPEQGVLSASRAEMNWKVPQFGPWTLSNRSAFEVSKGAVEGSMMVQTVLPNPFLERNSAFLRGYAKLSKELLIGSMMAASQTYDAVHLLLRAMFESKSDLSGPALKKALENLPRPYHGVVTTYDRPFTSQEHDAISINMLWLGTWRGGQRQFFYREDAKLGGEIRRKQ